MLLMSVSLAVFGLGMPLVVPATPVIDELTDSVDYRCGIIDIEENSGHPLSSGILEDLLIDTPGPNVRVATVGADLSGERPGELAAVLVGGQNPQALQAALAIQKANADVVLLTGFDADEHALRVFNDEYLMQAQPDGREIDYSHRYVGPSNRGVASGADLDQDKIIGGPADAWSYGQFPGQGSMVLLSKHPIDQDGIRTVTAQRWAELPDSKISEAELSDAVAGAMPIMESGLWDIPLNVSGQDIRVIAVQVNEDPKNTDYALSRRSDQLNVIGDWVSAEQYLVDDNGHTPNSENTYVVLGELGNDPKHNAAMDELLQKIGVAEQGVHDDTNYILAGSELEIIRHGSIGAAPTVESTSKATSATTGPASELLWSDLKF